MVEISKELLERFDMLSFSECMKRHPGTEKSFWTTFLRQTDYVPNKIIEAQALGEELDQDYTEILAARKLCREKLNALSE